MYNPFSQHSEASPINHTLHRQFACVDFSQVTILIKEKLLIGVLSFQDE